MITHSVKKQPRRAKPVDTPPVPTDRVESDHVGVVIGSYKWPELIDLQCRVIRAACGPVPILVSNDHPESNATLAAVCSAHPDVTLWSNPQRIGHTGGDISAFYKGVVWGASRSLAIVAKLSQRFFVTIPRWLQSGAADLVSSGLPCASRKCVGASRFDLRTEAMLLDVNRWNNPAVLARIKPRQYWNDSAYGLTAETIVYRVVQDLLGAIYFPWQLLEDQRQIRREGVVWHDANSVSDYRRLADEYGGRLPADFHCNGWQRELAAGQYSYG